MSGSYDKNRGEFLAFMDEKGHKPSERSDATASGVQAGKEAGTAKGVYKKKVADSARTTWADDDVVLNPSVDYDPTDREKIHKMMGDNKKPFGGKPKSQVFGEFANRCVLASGNPAKDADIFADAGLLHQTGSDAVYSQKKPEVGTVYRIGIALRLSESEMEEWAELFDKSFTYDTTDCAIRAFIRQEAYTNRLAWNHKSHKRREIWNKLFAFLETAQQDFPDIDLGLLLTRSEKNDYKSKKDE